MKKFNRLIALSLIFVLLSSLISFAEEPFESLETSVSKMLKGVNNLETAINIVKTQYGSKYSLTNNMELSVGVLKNYALAVYVKPVDNNLNYIGFKDLKNGAYRYLGYKPDGVTPVTNPYYTNDATTTTDLREKGWYAFNGNSSTYEKVFDEQATHLFTSPLYDPVGGNKRPVFLGGYHNNLKDILKKKISDGNEKKMKTYSQVGSVPTLNNEGSVMIKHRTSSGGEWYDTFVVDPLNLGAIYKSEISGGDTYVFKKGEDKKTVTVTVTTNIKFNKSTPFPDVVFKVGEQLIEFKGKKEKATYLGSDTLIKEFTYDIYRKDYKVGELVEVDLKATTHLKSSYGDEIKKVALGKLKVMVDPSELDADFKIMKDTTEVTNTIFPIGKEIVKLKDEETQKETIKRLNLSADLKLDANIFIEDSNNEITALNWFVFNFTTNSYDYFGHTVKTINKKIDKDNVDNYVDEEGNISFKLRVNGMYGTFTEAVRSTALKVDYKDAPAIPVNKPPNADVTSKDYMKAGSITSFSGLRSYDPDGYITNYQFNGYSGFRIKSINEEGTGGYGTPLVMGDATLRLTVTDNSDLTGTDNKNIRVVSPIEHKEVLRGVHKVNRKITLDSTLDEGTTYYPSSLFETSWTIEPVDGQSVNSIKWDTDNKGNLVDVLFKEEGLYKIFKTVKAKCTYLGDEDFVVVETIERGIRIYPDVKPVAQFALVKYNLRQVLDDTHATIKVYDTSYSPDDDKIYKRVWLYKYDTNNNGLFDDETYQVIDSVNDKKEIALRVKDVGRYEFKLSIEEDYTSETISRFLTPSDILSDNTDDMAKEEKIAEVLNVAPIVKLEEKANKKVDVIFVTDYLASDRADLESEMMLLTKQMQEKKLNMIPHMMNIYDEDNSIIIGKKEVPIFNYTRSVSMTLYYDAYMSTNGTRTYPGTLGYGYTLESTNKTEKEALLLPSYPLAYTSNPYSGYTSEGSSSTQNYVNIQGGSIDVYDEPNLLRGRIQFPQVLRVFANTMWGNLGMIDHSGYTFQGGTIRNVVGNVNKYFVKGGQVGTKLEDIKSLDVEKIKNLSLDEDSDKYLVVLTNNEDTTKSFDEEFLTYLKDNGFKIRYSVPDIAKETIATGNKYVDVRFTETSMILKTDTEKYFEIGNSSVTNQKTFAVETTDITNINKFNNSIATGYSGNRTIGITNISTSSSNVGMGFSGSTMLLKNGTLSLGTFSLSGVNKVFPNDIALFCEMNDGSVKIVTNGELSYGAVYTNSTQTLKVYDTELDKISETFIGNIDNTTYYTPIYNVPSNMTEAYVRRWIPNFTNSSKIALAKGLNGKIVSVLGKHKLIGGAVIKSVSSGFEIGWNLQHGIETSIINTLSNSTLIGTDFISKDGDIYKFGQISDKINTTFEKAYSYNDMNVYIKNGVIYGKGNSNNGQLGIVGNVADYRIVSDVILNETYKSKKYITLNQLMISPDCSSFSGAVDTLQSISNDYSDYSTDDTIYKLLGESLEFDTFYFDYEGDKMHDNKYDYTHTEIFDNSMGIDPINNTSTKELLKTYSKVGKYVIKPRYQDNPKDILAFNNYWLWNQDNTKINLIVHRKPIAKIRASYEQVGSDVFVTLGDGSSYDLDHTSMANKGIVEKVMLYKLSTDIDFKVATEGMTLKVEPSKTYNVIYKVNDVEGAWSDWDNLDINVGTITFNEAPTVKFTRTVPSSTIYAGDDIKNYIIPNDPDGDLLTVDYYVAAPGQAYSLYKTYLNVVPGVEFGLDKVLNSKNGIYKFKVIVSDGEYEAEDTKNVTVNKISVSASLLPHDPMAGDMLYFKVETIGFADKIEIILEDDIVNNDKRVLMGYKKVDYVGNSLFFSISNPSNLMSLTTCEYIVWVSTPQSLTLKNVRNRGIYKFEIKAYRGTHVSDIFVIEKEIKGDVRQTLKFRFK